MKFITAIAATCLCASALGQVQLGKGVAIGSGTATVTAPAMQSATSGLAGCTTAGNAWNPASNTCTPSSGGGSGSVVPSPQFKMGYYSSPGTVGTVQGDPGSTTDGNGNVILNSVTTSVTNRVFSLTGSDTQNNTAPQNANGNGEPFGVHNFNLNFSGYGKSIGNVGAGIANGDQGWRVAVGPQIQGNIYGAGIHQLMATNAKKWGIGDFSMLFLCPNALGCFSGGAVTPSDQGSQALLVSSTQFVTYYHGTVTATTGLGDTSPVLSAGATQQGGSAIIGGGYLINTSKTILAATLTGTASTSWESGTNALGVLTISGGATPTTGMCQITTAAVAASTILGIPQSQGFTCATHDALPIVTGKAWVASAAGEPLEQVTVTVSGACSTVGNCTITSATPHGIGAILFQGGTQGSLSFDDDQSVLGNRTDFPVVGAVDATHLIIAAPGYSGGAVGFPVGGVNYESLTGGIHVFASARITFVGTDGLTNHVETNSVNWQVGDNIESPTPSSYVENGIALFSTMHTQGNLSNPSLGIAVSNSGPVNTSYRPFIWANNFDTTKYVGNGGKMVAPPFLTQTGAQSNFATIHDPLPGGACNGTAAVICDLNPGSHTHDLLLFSDHQASHDITMHRSLGQIEFHDNIKTPNILITPLGTNGNISFGTAFGAPAIQYLDNGAAHRIGTGITGAGFIQNWCISGGGEVFNWVNGGDMGAGTTLMSLACDTGSLTQFAPATINSATAGKLTLTGGGVSGQNGMVFDVASASHQFYAYSGNIGVGGATGWGIFDLTSSAMRFSLFNSGNVAIGSSTDLGQLFQVGANFGVTSAGTVTAPKFQGTGTNPSLATGTASNTDVAGQLTLAAGTATFTFVNTYTSAPICVGGDTTATNAVKASATTTVLTLTGTGTDVVNYICIGRN